MSARKRKRRKISADKMVAAFVTDYEAAVKEDPDLHDRIEADLQRMYREAERAERLTPPKRKPRKA